MALESDHGRVRGRIRVRFGEKQVDRMAFTMNVSTTGAFIRTNNVYPPGRTIKVEFNFDEETTTLFAKVIWAKKVPPQLAHLLPCGMGVRFVDSGPEWEAILEKWESTRHKKATP